jgi:prevent-host-death family protein
MKTIELKDATERLAEYVKRMEGEPVTIAHTGVPLAVLVPAGNNDYESVQISTNPQIPLYFVVTPESSPTLLLWPAMSPLVSLQRPRPANRGAYSPRRRPQRPLPVACQDAAPSLRLLAAATALGAGASPPPAAGDEPLGGAGPRTPSPGRDA